MDIVMKVTTNVAAASFVVFAVACGGQNAESNPNTAPTPVAGSEPPSDVTEAQNRADNAVVHKLAAAHCDHEQKCNNIGKGQKYASRDVCEEQLRSSTSNDLNAETCPHGLDQSAIDHCMNAIGAEQCSLSLDTLSRGVDCRAGALCMR